MIRRNITKTFTLCLLSLAIVGCNQRRDNDTYTAIKGDREEASASEGKADSTTKVPYTKNTGTNNSLVVKEANKRKAEKKQLADLKRRTVSKYFANCDSDTLTVGRARLAVPSGAMTRPRVLSITPLKKGEIAQLPTGMVNVTGNCGSMMAQGDTVAGYRFLPHGNHFSRHLASITVPYDSTLIPKGYTVDDIHTYFYDEMKHQWTMLRSTGVDKEQEVAMAETSHFTDVINGIIKVPESPETQNYVPTGIKDLKAADPSAGIQQIEAPTANQNGTASISYPFETPAGRNDIAASAGLQYSSDGGSSYVGYGWSLPVTSIDIETRWGVPRFDEKYESESYLLMGQQLNDRVYRTPDAIERSSNKQFYPMVEGSFNKIIRKGNSPEDYYWEVTAKDGTVYRYGGSEETSLKDAKKHRIKWALERITDVHGNFAAFHYQKFGNNLYPRKYTWTGYGDEEGLFSIEFEIDSVSAQRVDVTKNGRLGLLQTDAALLKKVVVKNNGQQLRAYKPNYEEGPFGKTLLKSIDQFDSKDNLVASQSFEYYNDVENGLFGDKQEFASVEDSNDQPWKFFTHHIDDCDDGLSMLGGGYSSGKTVGGGMMVGFGIGPGTMNVGASYSHSKNEGVGKIALTDIDGDGLPDKVYKTSSGLRYRKNLAAEGKFEFGESRPITGIKDFSLSVSTSDVTSANAAVEAYIASAGISYTSTKDQDKTKIYFSDFNGDGLVDIAKNGIVYFNHSDGNNVSFSPSSKGTGNAIASGMKIELDDEFKTDPRELRKSLEKQFPLHDVVRVWRAPYSGNIQIKSTIQKLNSIGDGVEYSIQWKDRDPEKKGKIEGTDTIKREESYLLKNVSAGDKIFFRLHSIYSGKGDEVLWHPVIKYTDSAILTDTITNYLNIDDFEYDIEKDFVPGVSYITRFDKTGTLKISAPYTKDVTNDDITLVVTKKTKDGESILKRILLEADKVVNDLWEYTCDVDKNDSTTFLFTIETGAPIDWHKIDWKPTCFFSYMSNDGKVDDESVLTPLPMMYNKPIRVSKDYVKSENILKETATYKPYVWIYPNLNVGRESGEDKDTAIVHLVINDENGKFLYRKDLVLGTDNKLKKDSIFIEKEVAKLLLEGKARATYSILNELDKVAYANLVFKKDSIETIILDGNSITKTHKVAVDTLNAFVFSGFNSSDFGMLYRGWGQFAYKGDAGENGTNKIDVSVLKSDDDNYKDVAKRYKESQDQSMLEKALTNVNDKRFFSMGFNMNRNEYVSATDSAFVGITKMCSSRLGVTEIEVDTVDTVGDDGLSAPVLLTEASGNGYGVDGSVAFAGVSGSKNTTETYTTVGAMDLNGDSYPDWFEEKDDNLLIQYTKSNGVLGEQKLDTDIPCPMSESESSTLGASLSLSKNFGNANGALAVNICPKTKEGQTDSNESGNNNTNNAANASSGNIISSVSVSASGNYSDGSSRASREWQDVNGDGLPDMIIEDKVRYNLGYEFTPEMDRNTGLTTSSYSVNWGAGLGTKIGVLGTAFTSFGFNGTVSTNNNRVTYLDINGDGLPDILTYDEKNNACVLINTGNGYKDMATLDDANLGTNKSSSISVYGDVAVKISFHILFAKFCLTPSVKYSTSDGVNRTTAAIMDVDGDGLPDLVESNDADSLIFYPNLAGRTNKLKSVVLPFGGRFTISYEQTQPSFDHPGRQWVMSAVESIGGYEENGAVASKNTFEYEGGYRDRRERDFFGFRTVRTNQIDTENDDEVYRYTVQTYADNHDYYLHALVTSEALFTAKGDKLQESLYTYELKAQNGGEVQFPQLAKLVQNTFVEGCKDSLSTMVENSYDDYGNLIAYKETAADVVMDAEIGYHEKNDEHNYIVSVPQSIKVKSNGVTYRERSTEIDDKGEIVKITMYNNGDKKSVFSMAYDDYGNVVRSIKPENYKGEKMFYEYEYDDTYHSLITSVRDAFGYSSSTTYDALWLAPDTTIDLNGARMEYTYDALGRPATIRAPYEIESGQPFTIKYEYDAANRLAHTTHYSQDGNIDTYTFADSLMRAVQTKVTGVVWNGTKNEKVSIVSGRAVVDAFGRNVAAYYPTTESIGNITKYSRATGDPVSTTQYDAQDHPVEVRLADGATTRSEYAIVARDGETMLETTVTDALNHHAESYADAKGRQRATVQHDENGEVVVTYDYDAVGQVLAVHHPNGSTTTYEYDLLGQKTKVRHPDAGEVECTYDAAGNLIKKLTAQIKKTISADAGITYTYEYNRLKEVLYPENLFNRVTYTYGEPGDKYGRAGRLALVEDASGGEAYYYGKMGEVTKTVRTVMASLSDIRTYIYGATYDSWNRVRTMTYPDGEVVTYHYNEAGQIESLSSNKLGKENVIVEKIGYDKDGHTVYTKLGNGTETTYAYDKQRERLQSMILKAGEDCIMQNKYSYDAVDNIDSIINVGVGRSGLGGTSTHRYTYDMLNRLTSANGSAKDIKYAMSMTFGKMSEPLTKVQTVDSTSVAQSYNLAYKYESAEHPTAPTQIGHEHYTYDANGNPILVENDSTDATREMFWDEDNRLMVLSDNGKTSRYTYNAGGERIIKSHGSMEGVYINGAPQGITFHETDEFTLYPASIITVNRHRFTKHYFIGDKRVASRLGLGEFRNVYGSNGSNVTAGQQDYAERMNQIEQKREEYYKLAGVAPGLPTMKGSYADPEVTGRGYNELITEIGDHRVPENWVQRPVVNTEEGSNPGAPLAWGSPENPDDAVAGYGYVAADTSEVEETFYYHSDHLGSTSYITDQQANVTQYDAYLPYGELLVDEHSSSADLPYKFNGKELDEETGLYYYGARYMNPLTSMWYGVDPLAEMYPNVNAFVYCMGNPIKLVDFDGRNPTDKEAALIADDVYNKDSKAQLEGGWRRIFVKNMKMNDDKSGFKSALYGRWDEEQKKYTEYVYATAGTDMTSYDDWENNFKQVLTGNSAQYKLSVKNARTLAKRFKNLSFVGHSLGGGLASANSLATGKDGITFNAAGLSNKTKEKLNLNHTAAYIRAFIVKGEMLDNKQSMIGLKAEGNIIYFEHKGVITLPIGGLFGESLSAYAHTMDCVKKWFRNDPVPLSYGGRKGSSGGGNAW